MNGQDKDDAPKVEAPIQSADFWERPELRAALNDRHFGRFLRVYRLAHEPQVQQTQLAAWIGITQGQLSRIERAASPVHDLEKLDLWARLLHIPKHLLWFQAAPESTHAPSSQPSQTDSEPPRQEPGGDVPRRHVLKAASAAASASLLANSPWQRLIDSVDHARPVDSATVQLMQDRTASFFDTEETVPARQVLESLAKHKAIINTLLENARTDAIRNQLAVMLGETHALIGWLYFDLGRAAEAAGAWRQTLKISKATGDGPLAACALGYWSYLAASRNDIAPAVRLLQQAEDYVPGNTAPATRAWIAGREAEELGRLGEETAALRSLERAFTAFDFARPRTERLWTGFFTANRLGGLTVSTYIALNHRDASVAADSLLTALSPTDNKARALALADLTILAARNNDLDRASAIAEDAISVTTRTETSLARQRLLVLASNLDAGTNHGTSAALREKIVYSLRRQRAV
ncbi:helix-turn-helix domain-containing protein [Amycolatopsis sp. H20-H5]|uniref:helix-turn-helix domain-containing protein n=1 Tax=Amycolatopsis sp. H20-H5 TaxID=3046309 RepID=UPI002DB9A1B1|nr:helix-turn-helix transcriptional regulator [Amycolatopsis sp. H20-H5]MEC3978613.1 helix-turn-helix transcriptional regulator [Amycolatopsis sp. H20-H5]